MKNKRGKEKLSLAIMKIFLTMKFLKIVKIYQ